MGEPKAGYMGGFELMEGMAINERPVYRAVGKMRRFMYFSSTGRWFIGNNEKNMRAGKAAGWLRTAKVERGALAPENVKGDWQVWSSTTTINGPAEHGKSSWVSAPNVRVRQAAADYPLKIADDNGLKTCPADEEEGGDEEDKTEGVAADEGTEEDDDEEEEAATPAVKAKKKNKVTKKKGNEGGVAASKKTPKKKAPAKAMSIVTILDVNRECDSPSSLNSPHLLATEERS